MLALCGAVQALFQAPFEAWWLQVIVWVPVLLILDRLSPGRALLAGWLVGSAALVIGLSWLAPTLVEFSGLGRGASVAALIGLAVVGGFHVGVFGWGLRAVTRASGPWRPVAVAAWFVACEWLDPQLFPWYQGAAWASVHRLFGVVSLAGLPAVSFFALLISALLAEGLRGRFPGSGGCPLDRRALIRGGAVLAGFVLIALSWSSWRTARYDRLVTNAQTVRLALVQPDRDRQALDILRDEGRFAISEDLAALSRLAWEEHGPVDAFIWPEAALRGRPTLPRHRAAVGLARSTGAEIWTGATTRRRSEGGVRRFNSVYRLTADGELDERRYDKVIRVPFGEFDPLPGARGALPRVHGIGRLDPGVGIEVFETPVASPAFLICYEAIQREFARAARRRGADLLVTVTNDSWFGDRLGPRQHFGLAVARAAELGLPLVRAASTGISGVADARGRVIARSDLFQRQVLVVELPRVQLPSVYSWAGDWFAMLCVLCSALLLCLGAAALRPGPTRRWPPLLSVWLATTLIPAAWVFDPHLSPVHWPIWAATLLSLLWVAGLWRR